MKVEIDKHVGQMSTAIGVVDVEIGQYRVFASADDSDVRLVGYIDYSESMPWMPAGDGAYLPDVLLEQIRIECEKQLGRPVVSHRPIYHPPIEVQDEDDDQ
jgi:hypothetical protein